ncbi:MAG: hypothetical protein KIIPBIDF_01744 [Candidatus Methanoperedenaceae archaeon GB50]|nr:MAG: hypothetical protein KIIPBIDF_01744 [Candidatus Methanoperedenaceae archaeon GB50]
MSNVETRPLILIPEDQPNQALKMLYPKLRERRVAIGKIKRSDHKKSRFLS